MDSIKLSKALAGHLSATPSVVLLLADRCLGEGVLVKAGAPLFFEVTSSVSLVGTP